MINKTVTTKVVSSMSPIVRWLLALGGIFVLVAAIIIIRTTITSTNVSEQYDAIAVWQNNGEGNWDIAYSIYKQNSDSWLHQPDRDIYYEGDANLIAKLPGDDNDPDISSTRNKAMAVWSNTGMEGNSGADIVVSKWDSNGWSEPARLFAIAGDDVDPTIYMQDPERALVVWVNRVGNERTLYYSEYANGGWSNPEKIPFTGASKIATPELGYITVSNSRYLLLFTASVAGADSAYMGTYDRTSGWSVEKIDSGNTQALVNETIPAPFRVSVSMQTDSREIVMSWTGQDNNIWYIKASPENADFSAKISDVGVNPVAMHDPEGSTDADTILFSSADELVNVTPVGGDLRQTISSGEINVARADATYFWEQGKKAAVVVWSTKEEGEGEIYFSALGKRSQKWGAGDRIDSKVFSGEDLNPAIAPIIIQFDEENTIIKDEVKGVYEDGFCGNKILEKKFGEECEISVACGNVDKICDWEYYTKKVGKGWASLLSSCECLTPPDKITPPVSTPKTPEKEEKQGKSTKDVVYGGFSCGFHSVILKSSMKKAVETGQVTLQFSPESNPANGAVVFKGNYPRFQANVFNLFPLAGVSKTANLGIVEFSNDDTIITLRGTDPTSKIILSGTDPTAGFQLCVGTFKKGAPADSGGFVPASAPGGNSAVPALPDDH